MPRSPTPFNSLADFTKHLQDGGVVLGKDLLASLKDYDDGVKYAAGVFYNKIPIVLTVANFLHEKKYSALVRGYREGIVGLFGADENAVIQARSYLETQPHPHPDLLKNFLNWSLKSLLDSRVFNENSHTYFSDYNPEGVPFEGFELDPAPISQVKKIINALYYGEQAMLTVESTDPEQLSEVQLEELVNQLYRVSQLVTHPDVDYVKTFGPNIAFVMTLLTQLSVSTADYSKNISAFLREHKINLEDSDNALYRAGVISGVGINTLNPHGEGVDYGFLSQFGSDLPKYLAKMTDYINMWSTQVALKTENKEKWENLRERGEDLAALLNGLWSNQNIAYLPADFFNLLRVLYTARVLFDEIQAEFFNLNDASQDRLRNLLAQLKYDCIVPLLSVVDKIEEEGLWLKPGQFSQPFLNRMDGWYRAIQQPLGTVVDFSIKNRDLSQLQDGVFIAKRTAFRNERIAIRNASLVMSAEIQTQCIGFFAALRPYSNQRLRNLPADVKADLKRRYQLIQPELHAIDFNLNNAIMRALSERVDGLDISCDVYPDEVNELMGLVPKLEPYFTKNINTVHFYNQITRDAISYNYASMDEHLLNTVVSTKDVFTVSVPDDANIGEHYQNTERNVLELEQALAALEQFTTTLYSKRRSIEVHELDNIQQLRNLYTQFQPMLCSLLVRNKQLSDEIDFDAHLIEALSGINRRAEPLTIQRVLFVISPHFCAVFKEELNRVRSGLEEQKPAFASHTLALRAQMTLTLDESADQRLDYMVKNPIFFQGIQLLKEKIDNLLTVFNPSVLSRMTVIEDRQPVESLSDYALKILRDQLVNPIILKQTEPMPYKDVTNEVGNLQVAALAEPKLVLNLKRLMNLLHFLKQTSIHLENLSDIPEGSETAFDKVWYALDVILMGVQLTGAGTLIYEVSEDADLAVLIQDIKVTCESLKHDFELIRTPHVPPLTNNDAFAEPPGPIFYTLNSLFTVPRQLEALFNENPREALAAMDVKSVTQFAEGVAKDVNRIVENSDSWFKLILETPTYIRLFTQIKHRWDNFATDMSCMTKEHLSALYEEDIAAIMLETDKLEVRLGLKPGLFSVTMRRILESYYQGIIEPLVLDSREYFILATSPVVLNKRIAANQAELIQTHSEIESIATRERALEALDTALSEGDRQRVRELWESLLPALCNTRQASEYAYKKNVYNATPPLCTKEEFDALLNSDASTEEFLSNEANFAIIGAILDIHRYYLKGLHAASTLKHETLLGQQTFIQQEVIDQMALNEKLTSDYTKRLLFQRAKAYHAKARGFKFCKEAYNQAVDAYIKTHEDEIAASVQPRSVTKLLELQLDEHLARIMPEFDNNQLPLYRQYEKVESALHDLRQYIHVQRRYLSNRDWRKKVFTPDSWVLVEDEDTLNSKSERLLLVNQLFEDASIPLATRLAQVREEVLRPGFQLELCATKHYERFTVGWLMQCLVSLCEALHIFTPKRKAIYKDLVKALDQPQPNSSSLMNWGMFGPPPKPKGPDDAIILPAPPV